MAESVLELKKRAKKAGMPTDEARKATRAQLEDFLSNGSGPVKKKGAAKKTTTTAKKSSKNSTTKKSAQKTAPAASRKAKSATTGKAKRAASNGNGSGRHMVGTLDFNETDGWNPRENSPVNAIFKALKRFKGNVDKATDHLMPNARDFVSTKKADGSKRTKGEIEKLLRYRVLRTRFEFARRTGQHESSAERVEYGTGDYATTRSKKKGRKAAPAKNTRKASTKKPTAKRTTTKATTKKRRR